MVPLFNEGSIEGHWIISEAIFVTCFLKNTFLRIFAIFTGKRLRWSSFISIFIGHPSYEGSYKITVVCVCPSACLSVWHFSQEWVIVERLSANTLHLMRGWWNLAWRYLDMCNFRFYPATRIKIATFVVWCPYNEPISWSKLRELYEDFGSVFTVGNAPFCWKLIRKAFLLHSKDFHVLMIADLLYGIPILALNLL